MLINCCTNAANHTIIVGAEQPEIYLHQLSGKNVGLMVNHTSLVDTVHLVDFLLAEQVNVSRIFAVEHGFRGEAAYGEMVNNEIDPKTGIRIISLYNDKKKATPADLKEIDMVIFDMQDVGCRFYTYISSMHYMMEACAENGIPFMVLDRPNPNGDYIAGPVLKPAFRSFVGMHPIPVVHGCTVGELALMINGEGWLNGGKKCDLTVVPVKNYSHSDPYTLAIKPSPNLPNQLSVRLYPSLCFFEATNVSIGRGTLFPFQVIGFPGCPLDEISFTPKAIPGMSNAPLFENRVCTGIDLRNLENPPVFTLQYLIQFFNYHKTPDDFWKSKRWMNLLAGNNELVKQINQGWDEERIRATWSADLNRYKNIRKKYLCYTDFE